MRGALVQVLGAPRGAERARLDQVRPVAVTCWLHAWRLHGCYDQHARLGEVRPVAATRMVVAGLLQGCYMAVSRLLHGRYDCPFLDLRDLEISLDEIQSFIQQRKKGLQRRSVITSKLSPGTFATSLVTVRRKLLDALRGVHMFSTLDVTAAPPSNAACARSWRVAQVVDLPHGWPRKPPSRNSSSRPSRPIHQFAPWLLHGCYMAVTWQQSPVAPDPPIR